MVSQVCFCISRSFFTQSGTSALVSCQSVLTLPQSRGANLLAILAGMKQLSVALQARHNTVQQRAAAVLGRASKEGVHLAQLLREVLGRVPGELGDAQPRANKVDDDTRLVGRHQLAGEVADSERLGQLGEGVSVPASTHQPGTDNKGRERKEPTSS